MGPDEDIEVVKEDFQVRVTIKVIISMDQKSTSVIVVVFQGNLTQFDEN